MKALFFGSLMSLSLFVSPLFADDPATGFIQDPLAYPGQALTATQSDGSILSFNGVELELSDSDGVLISVLASLPAFTFGSFLKLSPAEDFVVLGESSLGNIYRVATDGSGSMLLANLQFNYDAAFESSNQLIVSAATAGFGMGNDLVRVDLNTGATTPLALLAGASGPVAIDNDGSLFYGTTSAAFPAPAGSTNILRFDAALLTGAVILDESDASVYCAGFDNASSLAFDTDHRDLFLAEVNSGLGINQIRLVGATPALSPILLTGAPGSFLSNLDFQRGDGQSKLRAFQDEAAGVLIYNITDFGTLIERNSLSPQRASLILSGPGTMGLGQVDLQVQNGQPFGTTLIFYGPFGNVIQPEFAVNLPAIDFPLLFGVNPASVTLLGTTVALDANGNGQISLSNPTGMVDIFSVQGLHSSTPGFRGTTYLAFL